MSPGRKPVKSSKFVMWRNGDEKNLKEYIYEIDMIYT